MRYLIEAFTPYAGTGDSIIEEFENDMDALDYAVEFCIENAQNFEYIVFGYNNTRKEVVKDFMTVENVTEEIAQEYYQQEIDDYYHDCYYIVTEVDKLDNEIRLVN